MQVTFELEPGSSKKKPKTATTVFACFSERCDEETGEVIIELSHQQAEEVVSRLLRMLRKVRICFDE